jgi:hypothetical protein
MDENKGKKSTQNKISTYDERGKTSVLRRKGDIV